MFILFGSLQPQREPICLIGMTSLIAVLSDHGNKTHVFHKTCYIVFFSISTSNLIKAKAVQIWLFHSLCFGLSRKFACHTIFSSKIAWRAKITSALPWTLFCLLHLARYSQWAGPLRVIRFKRDWGFFRERDKKKAGPLNLLKTSFLSRVSSLGFEMVFSNQSELKATMCGWCQAWENT